MISYNIQDLKIIKKVPPKTRTRGFNVDTWTKMQPVLKHLASNPSTIAQLNTLFPDFSVYNLRYLMSRFIKDEKIIITGQKNANKNKACIYALNPQISVYYAKKEC